MPSSALVRAGPGGNARLLARYQNPSYFYACGLQGGGTLWLGKRYGGSWYQFDSAPFTYSTASFYEIEFTVEGDNLTCSATDAATGRTVTVTSCQSYFGSGAVGTAALGLGEFDEVKVKTLS